GRQAHEDDRFADFNKRSLKLGLRAVRLEAGLERTVEVLVAIGTGGVVWFGVRQVLEGYITPGDLLVFTGYLASMYKPLRRVARLTARLSKATVCGERVADILAIEERVKEHKGAGRARRRPSRARSRSGACSSTIARGGRCSATSRSACNPDSWSASSVRTGRASRRFSDSSRGSTTRWRGRSGSTVATSRTSRSTRCAIRSASSCSSR